MASSYLQRIVGRMGTLPLPAAPALPLPDALLMPVFDPFVEAEPPDDLPLPPPVAPEAVAVSPPPSPAHDVQTVMPPAEPLSHTIMEVRTSPPLEVHEHDDPVAPPPERPVHPAEAAPTPDAPPSVVWRTEIVRARNAGADQLHRAGAARTRTRCCGAHGVRIRTALASIVSTTAPRFRGDDRGRRAADERATTT